MIVQEHVKELMFRAWAAAVKQATCDEYPDYCLSTFFEEIERKEFNTWLEEQEL